MSLYEGLGIDKDVGAGDTKSDVSGWSQSYKLLQSQLQAKKAAFNPPSKVRMRQSTGASLPPVVDLKKSGDELRFNQITGKMERISSAPMMGVVSSPFIVEPVPSLTGVTDEYDPFRPNDYEEIMKKRRELKEKEREEEKKRDLEEARESRRKRGRDRGGYDDDEKEFDRVRRRKEEEEEADYENRPKRGGGGAAIAPPTSLLEDVPPPKEPEDIIMPDRPRDAPPGASMGLAGSVASKIMAKYGYKEGQGLGKLEQGMSTALQVEKTSKRGGKIIHERDIPKVDAVAQEQKQFTNINLLKNPSKVILLLNMVGPGEVDEELQPETAEECSKYGKVIKCVIFEMPGAPDEEAVRIFVEFERVDAAIKAVVDLNGRFFGGRTVQARFYNLDKFRRFHLGDPIE